MNDRNKNYNKHNNKLNKIHQPKKKKKKQKVLEFLSPFQHKHISVIKIRLKQNKEKILKKKRKKK